MVSTRLDLLDIHIENIARTPFSTDDSWCVRVRLDLPADAQDQDIDSAIEVARRRRVYMLLQTRGYLPLLSFRPKITR